MKTHLESVIEEFGFSKDENRSSTILLGGKGLRDRFKGAPSLQAAAVDVSEGSMVTLHMAPHEADALALADGQPPESLHLTLAFLPEGVEAPEWLAERLGELAGWFAPLNGEVGGLGMFQAGPDGVPVVALADVVGVTELQVAVAELLAEAEVKVADSHGFVPHVTLGYDVQPDMESVGIPLTFDFLSLVVGPERWDSPLGGSIVAAFDASKHPHRPGGSSQGGEWAPKTYSEAEGGHPQGWGLGPEYKFKRDQHVGAPGGVAQVGPDRLAREVLQGTKDTQQLWSGSGPYGYDTRRVVDFQNPTIAGFLRDAQPGQAEPETLFLAGGSGSGKSTVLDALDDKPPDAVIVNPDLIKEKIPEYKRMVEGGSKYASFGVHEESSDVARRLLGEANAGGYHAIVDGTGDSAQGKFLAKIEAQQRIGRKVKVVMVDIPTNEAVKRAERRAKRTGRWVPEAEIRKIHKSVAANHIAWRDRVDDWEVWANDRKPPRMVARRVAGGPIEVLDSARYQQALDKAEE